MWYNMHNKGGRIFRITNDYSPHQTNKQTNKQTKEQRENNMKLRNLAFFGVMASILGVNGAYADTTDTAVVIASQAYVDAQNALDEKVADKEKVDYSAVTDKNSTTKYPSMKTLTTAINSVDLSDTLNSLDYADIDATGTGVVKTVTQEDGKIAVTKGTVGETDIADKAVTMPKTDFIVKQGTYTQGWNNASESGQTDDEKALAKAANATLNKDKYVPTVSAVEARITDAVNGKEDTSNKIDSITVGTYGGLDRVPNSDTKYPTVKVVADVQASLANKQDVSDSTVDAPEAGTSYIAITAGNDVGDNLEALDAKVKENATDIAARTITNIDGNYKLSDGTITDAQVYSIANANNKFQDKSESKVAQNGNYIQAGTNVAANLGLLDTQVKNNTDGVTNNSTAIGTLANLTTTSKTNLVGAINEVAGTAGNAVAKSNPTGGASNAYNIVSYNANGLVQTAKALNNTMHDINNATADATCSETNPCVLSYLGDTKGYRWTAMDLDGLSVDGGSSSN